jgi:hypothetical protein
MQPMRALWRVYELSYVGLLFAEVAEYEFIDPAFAQELMSTWWFPVDWLFTDFEPYGSWLDLDVRLVEWVLDLVG